jgi:hypothetical protein
MAAQQLVPHFGQGRDRDRLLRVLALDDAGKPPDVDKAVDLLDHLVLDLDRVRPPDSPAV